MSNPNGRQQLKEAKKNTTNYQRTINEVIDSYFNYADPRRSNIRLTVGKQRLVNNK